MLPSSSSRGGSMRRYGLKASCCSSRVPLSSKANPAASRTSQGSAAVRRSSSTGSKHLALSHSLLGTAKRTSPSTTVSSTARPLACELAPSPAKHNDSETRPPCCCSHGPSPPSLSAFTDAVRGVAVALLWLRVANKATRCCCLNQASTGSPLKAMMVELQTAMTRSAARRGAMHARPFNPGRRLNHAFAAVEPIRHLQSRQHHRCNSSSPDVS
mmetsp:Transcript_19494/g.35359  ORF Transcript_19494/g.35359 Transcript_19494/m.35359 type:complete len:214 (-) Transcript_19494:2-643(-)